MEKKTVNLYALVDEQTAETYFNTLKETVKLGLFHGAIMRLVLKDKEFTNKILEEMLKK